MRKVALLSLLLFGLIFAYLEFVHVKEARVNSSDGGVFGDKVTVINTWFPNTNSDVGLHDVNVSASSAILVNYENGEVLYAKDALKRLPAASTIKIMTALVALEKAGLDETYLVSKKASEVGEDSMGLSEGEKVSMEYLLYGLMLPSGNDAAVTIAEGIAETEDSFVALMNLKARELGMDNTKFVNATGLDVDGESQFTTAYDLATLAHYTWDKYPQFRNIVSKDHIFLEGTPLHKAFDLYNDTNLLTTYPGVGGIKPGFTWEAGYCLVTYAENRGIKLIGILLNSQDRRGEMAKLLDFGFSKYGVKVEHPEVL